MIYVSRFRVVLELHTRAHTYILCVHIHTHIYTEIELYVVI